MIKHPFRFCASYLGLALVITPLFPATMAGAEESPPAWIWSSKVPGDNDRFATRGHFEIDKSALEKAALLTVSCDNWAKVWVNGHEAFEATEWGMPGKMNVAKWLTAGNNVIAIHARNQGGAAGLVAELKIDGKVVLDSGDDWKISEKRVDGWQKPEFDDSGWSGATVIAKYGSGPWGEVFAAAAKPGKSTSRLAQPENLKLSAGFAVELLYEVPQDEGSWVSMTQDPKGRLIVCDQYGSLYRVTLPSLKSKDGLAVEKLETKVGNAHGLLYAMDSLYVVANEKDAGLYRLRDTNGDGKFDEEKLLRKIGGGGEHGPHAVVLGPDGESLYVLGGNHTKLPDPEVTTVAPGWQEDQILTRMPDANGHASGVMAPGGWICKTDADGKTWNLVSAGYRNEYDAAFNGDGELFTYDSDMEWDSGTPWYRPTRVCHATSGSEFGWRNGSGKMPAWYGDTLPPVLDIGPGCPTGVVIGSGAKFPGKYQKALFVLDWTYGTMYAMHLTPDGSSYTAEKEEFVTGVPLNLTDVEILPDGAMYFTVGGRRTPSGLYRVTYVGDESTAPVELTNADGRELRALRHGLELFHRPSPQAVDAAWPSLGHDDRFIRFAARIALEHQPVSEWQERALSESDPDKVITLAIGLARQGHRSLREKLFEKLNAISFADVDEQRRLEMLRAYQLVVIRMGKPEDALIAAAVEKVDASYPNADDRMNRELINLLVALGAPSVPAKTVPLLAQDSEIAVKEADPGLLERSAGYGRAFSDTIDSNPQKQQFYYAFALREAVNGWTPELRKGYFSWFQKARSFKGGNSFGGFIENIRKEALAKVPENERAELDAFSKEEAKLIPDGFADARKLEVNCLAGMKFDVEALEAKAGEKIGIVLKNTDPTRLMHNLVLVKPGQKDAVVQAALAIGPDAIQRNFVPDSDAIIASTPIVLPDKAFTLWLTLPTEPGDYPYICTYPGHGILMHGVLTVK
ncbi:MAG: plastocyanin/azurin family copper-binding protein [Verrucomicrobiales bacterium]